MIGSPDLLAFTSAEGFGEGEDDPDCEGPGLPEELSVPLLPVSNPWASAAQFRRDFILVAEFSEQVGPKPVLTVPDDPRVIGTFDLNHFSVRIMSVDYQASGPGQATSSSPGPRLNFSEDSKVILGDSAEDAFAYVHYLTLYDLEARGMVRPFCMAYVCSNQAKLTENYSELLTCFTQASDSLKTGNRQAFSIELQRKLQELEYTRLTLLQDAEQPTMENGSSDIEKKASELDAVQLSILNHRDLLRQVTSYPNRKLKQPDFLPYDLADSLSPTGFMPPEPGPAVRSTSSKAERCLKSLQELCNPYFLSLMKEQLADTERRLRGDRSVLRNARVTRSLSRRLKLTNFLFELWSPEDDEDGETAEVGLPRVTGGKGDIDVCQSDPLSLESFCSCVEEIPIKLEAPGVTRTVTPDPSGAMEMAGSMSSGDSIEVLGTEKSYRTQHVVAGSDSRAETLVDVMDTAVRRVDVGARRMRAYALRTNSQDSIEVLSTTESIFPDDLTAITEEEAEHQSLSHSLNSDDETPAECNSNLGEETKVNGATLESEAKKVQGDEERADRDESFQISGSGDILIKEAVECLRKNHVHRDTKMSKQAEVSVELMPKRPAIPQTVPSVPGLCVNFAPPVALARDEQPPPPGPLRLLSVDEASDCTSINGSSDPPSPTQNIHSNTCLDKKRRRKAGLRALRFLKQHSFSQHAVFCLLSGRALVVIGGDETLVWKTVDALSLFLPAPGPNGSAVMPCLSAPLQLSDLLTWRLMGIQRSSSSVIHSLTRYNRYLALLDLDQRTLRCPSYSGSLLDKLADPYTAISRGSTYLLHLESSLIMLANKALVFTFLPALQRPDTDEGKEDADKELFLLKGYCSSENDMMVMTFLSDLIKQRHAGRGPSVLRFSYSSMHLHRNTYAA